MSEAALTALLVVDEGGRTTLRAPKVGVFTEQPRDGSLVEPGASAGVLQQLSRRFRLVIPSGVSGRVVSGSSRDARAVSYGEALFQVIPASGIEAVPTAPSAEASVAIAGAKKIVAPTDGVFYRAPAREAAPYVAVGDRLVPGQPIGLIEVMKTFNPIVFDGAGFPAEAIVAAIVVDDGQEVRAGEILVVVKPHGA